MKHYFDTDGHEFQTPPDPYKGRSPMHMPDGSYNDDAFREMGGTITDDGELSPKERFLGALDDYLDELEDKAKELALNVTKAEFIEAAANSKMSTDLVVWARKKGVPDAMIAEARAQVLTFLADAQRPEIGLTWADIFPKPAN